MRWLRSVTAAARRLSAAYVGRPRDLAQWLEDAQINQGRNLRLQYLAGLSINLAREQEIYRGIVQYHRYPDEIFTLLISMECRLKRAVELGVCRQLSLDPIEGRTMRGF